MKRNTILLIALIIIAFISILLILTSRPFKIPENYNLKLQDNKSYLDGADKLYYIYDNKIIVETKSYFPSGNPKGTKHQSIVIYNNVTTENIKTINDINNLLKNENGEIAYDKWE